MPAINFNAIKYIFTVIFFTTISPSFAQQKITPEDAAKHVGDSVSVCGKVSIGGVMALLGIVDRISKKLLSSETDQTKTLIGQHLFTDGPPPNFFETYLSSVQKLFEDFKETNKSVPGFDTLLARITTASLN